jgi:Phage stabilisation protein
LKKIQLFGSGVFGKSSVITNQRRVNVYFEIREDQEKAKIAVLGTPGQTLFVNLGSSPARGMYPFGGYLLAVAGNTLYKITNLGVVTSIGTLQTAAGFVGMADNGKGVLIVDGSKGYFYDGTTFTSPIGDSFWSGATTVTFNDTYFLVDTQYTINGQYAKSPGYYLPGTPWVGTDIGNASSNPDSLIAIDSDHGFVILWGSATVEFHQDTGVAGFPYAPIVSATQQVGLAAKWSRAKFNNTIAFLGTNLQGGYSVYQLNGFTPQVISTRDVDAYFDDFPTVTDAVAMSYQWDGHPFYVLTFPSANRTFLYDGSTNIWSEQQTGTGLIGRYNSNQSVIFNGQVYVSDATTGNIYQLSDESFTDSGTPIMRLIQTRLIEDQGNVLSIDEIFSDLETGVGLQSGQGSNPQIMVSVSKDGGRTFGNERLMNVGAVGQYVGPRATLRRFGSSRGFVFRFRMTDPVKFAMVYGAAVIRGLGQ